MAYTEKEKWQIYSRFCSSYNLKAFKGLSIQLFRMWLGLDYCQVLDIEKASEFLTNKK